MDTCRNAKALHRATELLGGRDRLAVFLSVPLNSLHNWLAGREAPPSAALTLAMDVLVEDPGATRG
jgi:DNA-binding transcriptional regulator YiaG